MSFALFLGHLNQSRKDLYAKTRHINKVHDLLKKPILAEILSISRVILVFRKT